MSRRLLSARLAAGLSLVLVPSLVAAAPYDGSTFKGRIAWSADGNHNDPDDWAASPMTLAIFAEMGLKDRLVHFHYNCILTQTDPEWERKHAECVLGAAERYGYDKSLFFDCRQDLDGAVDAVVKAVNESSADNPLYLVVAGPMQVPVMGLLKSDPEKQKHVYCISHSRWNDGFSKYQYTHTKRDVIATGVHWVQIPDQNRLTAFGRFGSPSPPADFEPYFWMRDSNDPKVRFLWDCMVLSTRPDPSDSGMAYFLATGDTECDPRKLKRLIDDHQPPRPVAARKEVRLETENFRSLEGFDVEDSNDRGASHRLQVKSTGDRGRIQTPFAELFTAPRGRYDVDVRYSAANGSKTRFALLVNGAAQGESWQAGASEGWQTRTIRGVDVRAGDEIAVTTEGGASRLDYVQLTAVAPASAAAREASADPGSAPPAALVSFDGGTFRGRIAYSADGNFNDPDDWAASPMALAIFERCGVKDRLVHFDYNCIIPRNNPDWQQANTESVLGAAQRFGYDLSVFKECQGDLPGAIDSIARAINASTADDPLYFILAGPMEVPVLGIERSDPAKRKHVYCISHSRWNDGYSSKSRHDFFTHSKRSVIDLGVNWVQVASQNLLATNPYGRAALPREWAPFHWARDSQDPHVRFLWDRLVASTRPDCSDAGMAYFLMTGEEHPTPAAFRALIEGRAIPRPVGARREVRIEAENFQRLDGYEIEDRDDRTASHALNVKPTGGAGSIRTLFAQPWVAERGRYDVEVCYRNDPGGSCRYTVSVNGVAQGEGWQARGGSGWSRHTVPGVDVAAGDEIAIFAEGRPGRIDYVQLAQASPASNGRQATPAKSAATGPLDDPEALPGQLIVAGGVPGYLKYNGGGPAFLCGPDNPEEFLFLGALNPDGTRSGGNQEKLIETMAKAGVNAFHCQMFRMRRCNIKDEGDDQHCPFVDFDPAKPLNEKVLDQWDGWLTQLEDAGIVVYLEFYNDATDVERMGWVLDKNGNLHPDEKRFFETVVKRFRHHKNILWSIEESLNKLPRTRKPHFVALSKLVADTDVHHHPIVHSFVTPETSEHDFGADNVTSADFRDDPNIDIVTWLHVLPHGEDYEAQHQAYLKYSVIDNDRFIVMKNETEKFPTNPLQSRRYQWSSAMTGMHSMEAGHNVLKRVNLLPDDGRIKTFMEQTDFYTMRPADDRAAGSTKWVLAGDDSWIAYTYDARGPMGIQGLPAGRYDLLWFDTASGKQVRQAGLALPANGLWTKPDSIGGEIALYLRSTRAD